MNKDLSAVKKFVAGVRSHFIGYRIIYGIAPAFLLFLTASLIISISFALYPWILLPLIWDILVGITALFTIVWIVDSLSIHAPGSHQVASIIEKNGGAEHPVLLISLELQDNDQDNSFIEHTYKIAAKQITQFKPVKHNVPLSIWLSLGILPFWLLSIFHFEPSISHFWNMPFIKIAASEAIIAPGTLKIKRNEKVILKLNPLRTKLPSCRVTLTSLDGKKTESVQIRPDTSGNFVKIVDSVQESFVYQFFYGGHTFAPETVAVVPPPVLYGLQIRLVPPSYTGDFAREIPEGQGDIKVYAGTKVHFSIESEELTSALLITGKDSIPFNVNGKRANGEILVWDTTDYTFSLVDSRGQKSDSLPVFHIDIIPDDPPLVHFLKPGFNTELKPEQVETLWIEGIDDLGIRTLVLKSCHNGECNESVSEWDISPEGNPKTTRKQIIWNLLKYSLYPGDTLFYWAEIRDSKPFSPPGVSRSDTFWFRVPGFEEIQNRIVEQENYAEEKIEDVRGQQDNLKDMLENLVKSASGTNQLSWDQKQILQDVQQTIQAQSDSLQSALKSLEENVRKLKEQGSVGEEIGEKMSQIQKELKELIKQYGDSLFPDFKDNKSISMDDMRNAVENLQQMLPELNERLDNTIQFLEMLRKDREMAAMAMRAEKLAQDQAALAEQKPSVSSLEQQKNLLSEIGDLNRDLDKKTNDQLSLSSENISSLHKKMKSDVSKGQMPSTEQMNNMSASLLSASQKLRDMMSSTKAKQMQLDKKTIMDMANDALNLADWQQEILESLQGQEIRDIAITQQALRDALKKSSAKAESLKTIPPSLKNEIFKEYTKAIQGSIDAVQALGENSGIWVMRENKYALNSLANTLISIIEQMNQQTQGQGGSGGGLMDALRNLSGKQAAINAATSELLKSLMNGSNGKPSGMQGNSQDAEEARRAALEAQNALANELKKLAKKYGNQPGGGMNGRLDELEKEAQRIAKMLEQPQPEIAKHQDRFLSRMLQATLSMNRQGEGKEERKSKAAETIFSIDNNTGRGEIPDDPDTFYLLRQRALMGNFPESYREAIKEYFDSLEVLFLNK